MCILSVLLKVVGYYDLSVLSMSVMVSKKKFGWGVGGWVEIYQIFLDFLNFLLTLQGLLPISLRSHILCHLSNCYGHCPHLAVLNSLDVHSRRCRK